MEPEFETQFENLPCRLTEEEVNQHAREQSRLVSELEKHQAHAKDEKKRLADKEKELEAKIFDKAKIVESRTEVRPVECEQRPNRVRLTMETIRLDTGEMVHSRPLTDRERDDLLQESLPFDAPPAPKERARKPPLADVTDDELPPH